jgi:hypothetical protein
VDGFKYRLWDWGLTGEIDVLPFQQTAPTWEVSAPGTFTGQIPMFDPNLSSARILAATEPLKTRLYVERFGELAWGGRITEPRTYDSTTKMLTVNAEETVGYFAGRFTPTLKLYGYDQVSIAEQVIAAIQAVPNGDAQLNVTAVNGLSGVLRDGVYSKWDFTPGLQALTDMTEMAQGFEFASSVQWSSGVPHEELLIAYPYLGRRRQDSPNVIEFNKLTGGNCVSYQWPDGPGLATLTWASAQTPDGVQLVAWKYNTDLIDAGYPLIEAKADYSTSKPTTQASLQAFANRAAGWADGERVAAQFTVTPTDAMHLGTFTVGDDVLVRITDDRFPAGSQGQPGFHGWMRIGQIQCTPDANGLETYVITTLDYTEPV